MARRLDERRDRWTDEEVRALVREHERLVRAYLRSLGCPPDRVEDLAQETFLRLFLAPNGHRDAAALRATLCVTARNLFFNSLRDEARRADVAEVEQAWADYESDDGGSDYLEALRRCLEHLPARARELLRLRFGRNVPRAEIAVRMELSLGGVKSLLARSKESLHDCVRRRLSAESVDSLGVAR